jgi:hypothetical protein
VIWPELFRALLIVVIRIMLYLLYNEKLYLRIIRVAQIHDQDLNMHESKANNSLGIVAVIIAAI